MPEVHIRTRRLLAVVVALGLVAVPDVASAHAELVGSMPGANESLAESPADLVLDFSEAVDGATASVRLLDTQQSEIELMNGLAVEAEGERIRLPLPELEPGTYTVEYRVVSAVDGHTTSGIFAFLVDPTGIEPPPPQAAESTTPSEEPSTIAARWIALVASLILFGTAVFWLVSARPALRRAGLSRLDGVAIWPLLALAAALAFTALASNLTLAAQAFVAPEPGARGHHTSGIPFDFAAPFGWTPFAIAMRVSLVALLLCFVVAAVSYVRSGDQRRESASSPAALLVVAVLAAAGLGGFSYAAHASAYGGPLFATFDWLHMVAAGAWLGGLPGFFLIAVLARRGSASAGLIGASLRSHGRVALVAAPLVALTGIANAPVVLGQARELVASSYGNLLIAKVLLFSVAVAIGSVNLMLGRRGRGVRLSIIGIELLVAVVAVLAAAAMVTVQPAVARAPGLSASAVSSAHLYGMAGESSVHAAVDLPAPGAQTYQAIIGDAATGRPRHDVQRVFFVFHPPPASELPPERVPLEPGAQPWLFGTRGAYTPVVGDWTVEVVVRRVGERDESVEFALPVAEPLPPQAVPAPTTGMAAPLPITWLWAALPPGSSGWAVPLVLLAGVAVAAGWEAARARRGRGAPRWVGGLRLALMAAAVLTGIGAGSRAVVEAANAPDPERTAAVSPLAADGGSLERGRSVYLANCASCHGPDGDPAAAAGERAAPQHLGPALSRMTEGELYWIVTTGRAGTEMPAFAATLSENDRWDLVNYLRDRWPAE